MFAIFLTSGLFLGWSLGANDAANVFGTAVGTRMISFKKAAIFCGIFVILGAVISGAGAAKTLGELGAVNAIAGAFVVALAAAVTVYWLTVLGYPVSTTQAIVGAIMGWDLFSGALIDYGALEKIVLSWIISPILAAVFSALLYKVIAYGIKNARIHMFSLDALTRAGLLIAGIAGSYSLGANNISNVVGIFVPISPFSDISFLGWFKLNAAQQLFLLGGVAIAVGTFTYGKKVMLTVGEGITEMSPVAALVAVLANAVVLFLFASQDLQSFLLGHGLPAFPLVPVSSSQAIVGSVIEGDPLADARRDHRGVDGDADRCHPDQLHLPVHPPERLSAEDLHSCRVPGDRGGGAADPDGGDPDGSSGRSPEEDLSQCLSVSKGHIGAGDPERPGDERRHGGDGDRSDDGDEPVGQPGQRIQPQG
jgi:PiT family inorganic phosphate transporter